MNKNKKRKYNLEYKQQAAQLAQQIGTRKAASQLGVNMSTLHSWKKASLKEEVSEKKSDSKSKPALEAEIKKLQRENEELKKVNYILKKAAAFFSQDHLK